MLALYTVATQLAPQTFNSFSSPGEQLDAERGHGEEVKALLVVRHRELSLDAVGDLAGSFLDLRFDLLRPVLFAPVGPLELHDTRPWRRLLAFRWRLGALLGLW